MKTLPIGEQYFPKLRREEYLYVDKTPLLWHMISKGSGYFLARPRRFGKSLLVSTLAALFRGEQELFSDLWINQQEYDWPRYPVIHLDFSLVYAHTPEMTTSTLNQCLVNIASELGIELPCDPYPAITFQRLIRLLDKSEGVVILIDEYDKPIVNHLDDLPLLKANREILRDFFTVIKASRANVRFAFITGVSKFSKVSLFSGMNNLIDITLAPAYVALAGITEDEIKQYYEPYIAEAALQRGQTADEVRQLMRTWYNGYRFGSALDAAKVYNPISLHLFLSTYQLRNYWFSTATPTFAIELIHKQNYPVPNFDKGATIGMELEENHESDTPNLIALLFQTGYLTIANFDEVSLTYLLTFPNEEVRLSFYDHLLRVLQH